MNEMLRFTCGPSSLVESSDSGHLAFALALDSVVVEAYYILGLEGTKPPYLERRLFEESRLRD